MQTEFQEWNKPISRVVEYNNNRDMPIYIFMKQVKGRTRYKSNSPRIQVKLLGLTDRIHIIFKVNLSRDYFQRQEY